MNKIVKYIPDKYRNFVREKAIKKATTRIIIAGRKVSDFSEEELEIVVAEEEEKIRQAVKEKGLLALLAILGFNLFG